MTINPKNWVNIGFAACSIILFFVVRQVVELVWDVARLPIYEDWVVGLPVIVAVLLSLFVFLSLHKSNKTKVFTTEVVVELSKVTYPVKKETLISAVVVVVMVSIASLILFLFDTLWGTITQGFLAT